MPGRSRGSGTAVAAFVGFAETRSVPRADTGHQLEPVRPDCSAASSTATTWPTRSTATSPTAAAPRTSCGSAAGRAPNGGQRPEQAVLAAGGELGGFRVAALPVRDGRDLGRDRRRGRRELAGGPLQAGGPAGRQVAETLRRVHPPQTSGATSSPRCANVEADRGRRGAGRHASDPAGEPCDRRRRRRARHTAAAPATARPRRSTSATSTARTGFGGLETIDEITMVAVPDLMSAYQRGVIDAEGVKTVQLAMISHCEQMGDRVAVLDTPPGLNAQQVTDVAQDEAGYDSRYAALYYPWIKVFDPAVGRQHHRAAERARRRRVGAQRRRARGAQGAGERGDPRRGRPRDRRSARASRTCSTRSASTASGPSPAGASGSGAPARSRPTRPGATSTSAACSTTSRSRSCWAPSGWSSSRTTTGCGRSIRRNITAFLTEEWRRGALFGRTADEAFYVKCDRDNNPQQSIDSGQVDLRDRGRAGQARRVRDLPAGAVLRQHQPRQRVTRIAGQRSRMKGASRQGDALATHASACNSAAYRSSRPGGQRADHRAGRGRGPQSHHARASRSSEAARGRQGRRGDDHPWSGQEQRVHQVDQADPQQRCRAAQRGRT